MEIISKFLKKIRALNENSKYIEVIDCLSDVLLTEYNSADLYVEKAQAYYRLEIKEACDTYLNAALTIDPNNAKGITFKAARYTDQEMYDLAIDCHEKAIKLDSQLAFPYNGLANIFYAQKEYSRAIEFYNKSINLNSTYSSPYNGLANVYSALNDNIKAVDYYNKAIEIDPSNSYPYNGLANVFFQLNDYDKALNYYNKAIQLNPNYSLHFYNRARLFQHLNGKKNYKNAIADYRKYLELTEKKNDFYSQIARANIETLQLKIDKPSYAEISDIVEKIKNILLFVEESVTHYTGISIAQKLILEKSEFRLSEGAFLNDTSEGKELFKFLGHFNTVIDVANKSDTVASLFIKKPFIGSFVSEKKHDDLTLWRMYGREGKEDGKGCAITLQRQKILDYVHGKYLPGGTNNSQNNFERFEFYRVAYFNGETSRFIIPGVLDDSEFNKLMKKLKISVGKINKSNLKELEEVGTLLNTITYLFKTSEYQYEHELRLVVDAIDIDLIEKNINIDSMPPRVYIELVEIAPLVCKITLGPKVDRADEWAAAFSYHLAKEGHKPNIYISHLPYK